MPSELQVAVVVLALLAAAWLLHRRLLRRWQAEADRLTAELHDAGERVIADLARLRADAAHYPPDSPVPYAVPAQRLHALLASLPGRDAPVGRLPADRLPPASPSPHRSGYLFPRLRALHRRRTDLRRALADLSRLHPPITAAETLLRELREQPLVTARRARDLMTTLDNAFAHLEHLQAGGACGAHLDALVLILQRHKSRIISLPAYLLEGTDSRIVRQADHHAIAGAWQTLTEIEPELNECASNLKRWHEALRHVPSALREMDEMVASATACLEAAHPAIDTRELAEALTATRTRARDLAACYAAPTLDDLDQVARIDSVTQEANRLIARLASLEALRTSLAESIREATTRLTELERQLRQLGDAGRYPLDRVPFQAELDRLRRRLPPSGSPEPPRTMEALQADLAAAQVVDQQIATLTTRLAEAREERRRLIETLDAASQATAGASEPAWLAWAQDLHARTRGYHADNWRSPEGLGVATLLADAESLANRRRIWVPERPEDPLEPSTLARRLREVQAILRDTEALEHRLDAITRRLQTLQETEEAARADLEAAYGALDRLEMAAAGILPAALAEEENHWSALRAHLSDGYDLDAVLDDRAHDTVVHKAEAVDAWIAACRVTLSDWRRVLHRELEATYTGLAADIEELRTVAPLDEEATVREARAALDVVAQPLQGAADRGGVTKEIQRLTALATEVTERLRTLAQLDQAAAALREAVLIPLHEPVLRCRAAQQEAEAALRRLQRLEIQSARLWPPVSCDTEGVKAQLDQAQAAQATLAREGTALKRALVALKELTQRYQAVVALVEARSQAYTTLRPQLDATLERLERWIEALERYRRDHEDDPAVVAAIRLRLDEIESATRQLQTDWQRTDALVPGDQALRALEGLWRQAHRDIPIGAANHVIPTKWIESA